MRAFKKFAVLAKLPAMTPSPTQRAVPSRATIPTTSETMSSLEHADPPFAADAPALTATEPALPFVRAPRRCFSPRSRQNHSPDSARERGIFVLSRRETTIRGGEVWSAPEDLDVTIERGRPQRHVRWSLRMNRKR